MAFVRGVCDGNVLIFHIGLPSTRAKTPMTKHLWVNKHPNG